MAEVQEFISKNYHIHLHLKGYQKDKIKVCYFLSLVLSVKEGDADEIVFHYESSGLVNLVAKSARFLLKKKLENTAVKWNSSQRWVYVDLSRFKALDELMKQWSVQELHFINGKIIVELKIKPIEQS